jgi:hypothetical protein
MSLPAVRAIFAKMSELEKNALTTSFAMSFISNVPAVSKADPAITLVHTAERKLIWAVLICDFELKNGKTALY